MNKLPRKVKRAFAYLFDMIIMFIVLYLIKSYIPKTLNITNLDLEMNSINELLFSNKINFMTYLNRYAIIMHDLDKENILLSIFNAIYIIIYFVIIPYFNKSRTLGKVVFGLKIEKSDKSKLTVDDLLLRSMVTTGLLYLLFTLVSVYVFSGLVYFVIAIILGIIQTLLLIISIFMVIYRKDDKGLQDLLAKTKVVINQK